MCSSNEMNKTIFFSSVLVSMDKSPLFILMFWAQAIGINSVRYFVDINGDVHLFEINKTNRLRVFCYKYIGYIRSRHIHQKRELQFQCKEINRKLSISK